jgi:adenosylcobinamide-GDP ribazoletransferase
MAMGFLGDAGRRLSYNDLAIARQKCHNDRMADENARDSEPILSGWGRDFRVAWTFLTRIPLGRPDAITTEALSCSFRAFPIVGALVGVASGLAYVLAVAAGLSPWLAAFVALLVSVGVTGALHEDGLADVADGFAGGTDRARKLDIMADSRIGAYGVLALMFSVGLRSAALVALAAPTEVAAALVAAHALGRGVIPALMHGHEAVRPGGLGATAGTPTRATVVTALGLAAAIVVVVLGPWAGLLALAAGGLVTWLVAALARWQIGGYTGDVLGALEQAVETIVLIAVVAAR